MLYSWRFYSDSCGARGNAECCGVVGGGGEAVAEVFVEDLGGVVFIMVNDHDGTRTASVPLPLESGYDNALGRGEGAAEEALEDPIVGIGEGVGSATVGCDDAAEHCFCCKVSGVFEGIGSDGGVLSDKSDGSDGSDRDEGLV